MLAVTSAAGESLQVSVPPNTVPGQKFLVRIRPAARPSIASSVQILPVQHQVPSVEMVGTGGYLPEAAPAVPVDSMHANSIDPSLQLNTGSHGKAVR